MLLLAVGLILFSAVHLVPSVAPGLKARWLGGLGEGGYKGTFSLLLVAAFALMITGWRSSLPEFVYRPPPVLHIPALALIFVAFWLFVLSKRDSRLCLLVRHPQLTGVALWGIAHLLLNGDSRSLVLFGGMSVWAVVEILAINRRDGLWIKGSAPSWTYEAINLAVSALVFAGVIYIHPWLAGVAVR